MSNELSPDNVQRKHTADAYSHGNTVADHSDVAPPTALAALHRALGGPVSDLAPIMQEWLLGGTPAPRDPAQFVFGGPGYPGTVDWLRFMALQHGLGIAPPGPAVAAPGAGPFRATPDPREAGSGQDAGIVAPPQPDYSHPMPSGSTMGPRG